MKSFCANIDKVENKKDLLPPPRFNQHGKEILNNELNLNEEEINKIFLWFYFFQNAEENIIRMVNNSNLPKSIKKDRNHFPKSGIWEKL